MRLLLCFFCRGTEYVRSRTKKNAFRNNILENIIYLVFKANGEFFSEWILLWANPSVLYGVPTRQVLHVFPSSFQCISLHHRNAGKYSHPSCSSKGIFPSSAIKTPVSVPNTYRSFRWCFVTTSICSSFHFHSTSSDLNFVILLWA